MEQKKIRKIAYVSTLKGSPWGGSEELWFLSAKKALSNNDQIGVFIYDWKELPKKIQWLKDKGTQIFKRPFHPSISHRILKKFFDKLNISNPNFLNPYKSLIDYNPDVIVVTDGATYYAENDVWLRKVLTENFEGKFIIICQGNTLYHIPKSRKSAVSFFEMAKKIVFVSDRNRQECFHQLGHQLENTMVIQNPINLSKIELIPTPPVSDTIHIALVGRLSIADKGIDMVIAMASKAHWRDANVHFHVYGSGQDKDYLVDLINYYGVGDKFFVEGFLDPISIYNKCQCLVMLSLLEGTSLALLEAMALGRVCIVSDVGGSCEWIQDGINGYLVEAPTANLLDKKLKTAIENKENWATMGEKAHQQMLDRIDYFPGETLYNIC